MANNQLPAEVHRRIEQDAKEKYTGHSTLSIANKNGYIAGATAEAIRTADEIDKALHAERNKMQLKFSEADKQWADLLKQREDRAQVLVDALEWIQMHAPIEPIVDDVISNAIQQWKEGKEKPSEEEKYQQWKKENVTVLGEFDFLVFNKRIYGKKELRRLYDYLTTPKQ